MFLVVAVAAALHFVQYIYGGFPNSGQRRRRRCSELSPLLLPPLTLVLLQCKADQVLGSASLGRSPMYYCSLLCAAKVDCLQTGCFRASLPGRLGLHFEKKSS